MAKRPSEIASPEAARPSAAPSEPLLVVDDLHAWFRTPRGIVRAVDGVSFSLERGKTLGLVGESGSGKSVLSRSVMGLARGRDVIRRGSVRLAGREISSMREKDLRRTWATEMAMVFQDPMTSLNPVVRIGQQVMEPMLIHLGISRREARARAVELLRSVGIAAPEARMREHPHQLSGGMRQRVWIAIALACEPTVLFADEPTTALDVTVQAQVLELLRSKREERNMSMVLVSHDLGVVGGYADEIAVMYAGKIVEKAPAARLFSDTKMPYTEALLHSIPQLDQPVHTRLSVIPGRPPNLSDPPPGCRFAPRCPYAQPRCMAEEPPLMPVDRVPEHQFACWFPVGSEEAAQARELNRQRGRTAAASVGVAS